MNPSTGTFISMDSYQGSIYDPVSLHKYLYANANPVMYTDPSGYSAENAIALEGNSILAVGQAWNESVMFKIGMQLLAKAYLVHGTTIIRSLYAGTIAYLLLNSNNLDSIDRWAECINLYVENEVTADIPEDVEEEKTENSSDEEESENSPEDEEESVENEKGRQALDQLGKDLENAYKHNGSRITEEEARIIDDMCKEYGRSQHHDTDGYFKNPHWVGGPHTHIGSRHIPFQ